MDVRLDRVSVDRTVDGLLPAALSTAPRPSVNRIRYAADPADVSLGYIGGRRCGKRLSDDRSAGVDGDMVFVSTRDHATMAMGGILGGMIGFIGLVAAPGNFVRVNSVTHTLARRLGNQIAGNAEMILYILPLILLAVICYRLLAVARVPRDVPSRRTGFIGLGITLGIALLLAHSYFTTGYLGMGLRDLIFNHILVPLGKADRNCTFVSATSPAAWRNTDCISHCSLWRITVCCVHFI